MAEAFFLDASDGGQRFCIFHPAEGGALPRGRLLYLHPFAEEMNKARRMAALQCRALAAAGFELLQIDLQGCGDSSGDFGEASWQGWLDDVRLGSDWLQQRGGTAALWLWGLRSGCLLAAQAAQDLAPQADFAGQIWWQPPATGKLLAQQWLRLKTAGELLGSAGKGAAEQLQAQLRAGQTIEVAGYACSAALLQGLEQARLLPPPASSRLAWFELSRQEPPALAPVGANTMAAWQAAGLKVEASALAGPAFWQTSEIELAPALLTATTQWLQAAS